MKWLWTRHHRDDRGADDAHEALEYALDQWPAVRETSDHIRRLRAKNHFAENIYRALEGR
jgi:hypothetical protein